MKIYRLIEGLIAVLLSISNAQASVSFWNLGAEAQAGSNTSGDKINSNEFSWSIPLNRTAQAISDAYVTSSEDHGPTTSTVALKINESSSGSLFDIEMSSSYAGQVTLPFLGATLCCSNSLTLANVVFTADATTTYDLSAPFKKRKQLCSL